MFVFLCGVAAIRCQADTVDQQQLVYDGGTSARTLPGYTVWQSFTAGLTGTLAEIDMGFFNDMSGGVVASNIIRWGEQWPWCCAKPIVSNTGDTYAENFVRNHDGRRSGARVHVRDERAR
jgi:hypothetical protein